MRPFFFAALVAMTAGSALAQDFYASPLPVLPASGSAYAAIAPGDLRCFTVSVPSTRHYTFTLSTKAAGCEPVPGVIGLYAPGTLDPTMWMAMTDVADTGKCVTLQRRLTTGDYTLCASGAHGEGAKLNVQSAYVSAGGTPKNDTCPNATVLTGTSGSIASTTLLGANHDLSTMPRAVCEAASGSKGPDRVWAIDVAPGQMLTVDLRFTSGNPTLYLLSECKRWWNACLTASPTSSTSGRSVSWKNQGSSTVRTFIVVDTKVQQSSTFSFTWVRQ